jgi:hypothetical protein
MIRFEYEGKTYRISIIEAVAAVGAVAALTAWFIMTITQGS